MKKIAKDVALATILSILGGYQKIKVVDRIDRYVEPNAKVIYEGYLIDRERDTFNDDQMHAKVVEIKSDNDVIVISICTAWEALRML